MNDPFYYLYENKGKEIREKFGRKCFQYFGVPEKYDEMIPFFEKIHCFSLLIDDIQDKSIKRRGKDCSHIVYGVPWTIASSLSVYMDILTFISNNCKQEIISIFLNNLNNAFKSQLKEIYYRDNKKPINYNDYTEIVIGKTSALLQIILETAYFLGKEKKNNIKEIVSIVVDCGILFQINDDYNNLTLEDMHKKKGFAEDLDEQKYSYIIVKYLEKNPEDYEFKKLFHKENKTEEDKKKIINILSSEIKESKNYINNLKLKIKNKIKINNLNLLFDDFLGAFKIQK